MTIRSLSHDPRFWLLRSRPGPQKGDLRLQHADWYVAEIVQLAARYGGIGASGGGLIDGWADRPPLNQYDRRNYRSDQSWLTACGSR